MKNKYINYTILFIVATIALLRIVGSMPDFATQTQAQKNIVISMSSLFAICVLVAIAIATIDYFRHRKKL